MRPLLLCALAACAHAPAQARGQVVPGDLTQRSHAVLDAVDRGDVAAVRAAMAPTFIHFEGSKPETLDELVGKIAKRGPSDHIGQRTWDDERVIVHDDDALFIGRATEVQAGNTVHGGFRYVGWYMLQWQRAAGGGWKLALWTWHRGGDGAERDGWNDIFRNGVGFTKEPNRLLVETVRGRRPGSALDVAMGQGRNALYLASQGWVVTGVDMSDVGIRQAREEAARRGLSLQTVDANIDGFDFGTAKWDLVTMIYAGNDKAWIGRIQQSLKPGGLFVLEYFAGEGGFAAGELAKLFAGYDIARDELVEDTPDWAMDRAKLVRFVAAKR